MDQQYDGKEPSSKTEEKEESGREKHERSSSTTKTIGVPKRYIMLLMIFVGFVNIYAMRVNLNVALVGMVNNQTIIQGGVKIIKVC